MQPLIVMERKMNPRFSKDETVVLVRTGQVGKVLKVEYSFALDQYTYTVMFSDNSSLLSVGIKETESGVVGVFPSDSNVEDYQRLVAERDAFADAVVSIFLRHFVDSSTSPTSITAKAISEAIDTVYEEHSDVLDAAFKRYGNVEDADFGEEDES